MRELVKVILPQWLVWVLLFLWCISTGMTIVKIHYNYQALDRQEKMAHCNE